MFLISQGPIVQSIISLMSPLVVKMLTALVSTICNSQVILLKKCELHLQIISIYAIFNDQSFNNMLVLNNWAQNFIDRCLFSGVAVYSSHISSRLHSGRLFGEYDSEHTVLTQVFRHL